MRRLKKVFLGKSRQRVDFVEVFSAHRKRLPEKNVHREPAVPDAIRNSHQTKRSSH
jgi:hypothetical protein